jgi:hypothetical protein
MRILALYNRIFIVLILVLIGTPLSAATRSIDHNNTINQEYNISNITEPLPKLAGLPLTSPPIAGSIEVNQNPAYINYTPTELVQNIF